MLIEGPSGAGKSDLALRLIDRGATLVSDDYTLVAAVGGELIASPPDTIAGRIEVRGLGILAMAYRASVPVVLAVQLTDSPERLPDGTATRAIAEIAVPRVEIDPRTASAAIKVELAVRRQTGAA